MCAGRHQVAVIRAVLVGRAVPYTRPGTMSAIDKRAVAGSVWMGPLGVEGDEQGDRRAHGGPDKAVLMYAFEHYETWRAEIGVRPVLMNAGAFGENLSTWGMTETEVCFGDLLRIGSVVAEVAQGRQPCWKLNDRFGVPDMMERVRASRRTGWYLRILQNGCVKAGDFVILVKRPYPDWSIFRMNGLLPPHPFDKQALETATALPLTPGWRGAIEARLARG